MNKPFLKLAGKLILAPMHNITNIAFRSMCREYGASLVFTELISANALARKNKATLKLIEFDKNEKPISGQIFSNNIENMKISAKILEEIGFDVIDINFGCPSDRILKQGSGGALLKRKSKIGEIVKEVSSSVNIPISVKIRLGFDKESINFLEVGKICEDNGASAITLHARTVKQGYSGKADWYSILKLKKELKIPVIGNGDIFSGEDAKMILEKTDCDYIMIGRAAIGNPFIFKQINHYLNTGEIISQTKEEKILDYFKYIELTKKYDIFSVKDAKLRAQEFTKGFSGSSKFRERLNKIKSFEEIEKELDKLKKLR